MPRVTVPVFFKDFFPSFSETTRVPGYGNIATANPAHRNNVLWIFLVLHKKTMQ